MSEKETQTAPPEETVKADPPKDKQELYANLAEGLNNKVQARFAPVAKRVKEKHDEEIHLRKVFGDDDGRQLVVDVLEALLAILTSVKEGATELEKGTTVGLPAGLGSFELLTAGATTKRTPQGQMIDVPERWRIKWNTGKAVDELLAKLPPPKQTPKEAKAPVAAQA